MKLWRRRAEGVLVGTYCHAGGVNAGWCRSNCFPLTPLSRTRTSHAHCDFSSIEVVLSPRGSLGGALADGPATNLGVGLLSNRIGSDRIFANSIRLGFDVIR